jgi:hypothetical protein
MRRAAIDRQPVKFRCAGTLLKIVRPEKSYPFYNASAVKNQCRRSKACVTFKQRFVAEMQRSFVRSYAVRELR